MRLAYGESTECAFDILISIVYGFSFVLLIVVPYKISFGKKRSLLPTRTKYVCDYF